MELTDTLANEIEFLVSDLCSKVPDNAESGQTYLGEIPISETLSDMIDQNEVMILDRTILPRITALLGQRHFHLVLTRTYLDWNDENTQVLQLGTTDVDD